MKLTERPTDDRQDASLAAYELPATDSEAGATCPLLEGDIQLLPLRYAIAEQLDPFGELSLPYSLDSRPLGIRVIRNGYVYVMDETADELHEYRIEGNDISGHNGGKLRYPLQHRLYASFSEIKWTSAKRAQMLDSQEDRKHFMQAVNLAGANAICGGQNLITPAQANKWVAEFAEDAQLETFDEGYPQESEPYHWENEPYYHKSRLGKLFKQHGVEDPNECLCLILRDDIGVMRDLAQYQDHVVDWITTWAEQNDGRTERDYVLGCYIESITQLSGEALEALEEIDAGAERQEMWNDLRNLNTEPEQDTRQAILDYLNDDTPLPGIDDSNLPADLQTELLEIEQNSGSANYYYKGFAAQQSIIIERNQTQAIQHYYAREALQNADPAFVDEHLDTLITAKREHDRRVEDILEGGNWGQRGVNELIDRPGMDAFLEAQRTKLTRWNALLDSITADRVAMLCNDRFHIAAWYFDAQDSTQIETAFAAEYSCTRDICRSDEASEKVYAWLEDNPHYDRPLFHTLSLQQQSALIKQYADIFNAGYKIITGFPEWLEKLQNIERDKLPEIATLPENAQALADGAHANMNPALGIGIAKALEPLYLASGGQALPPLEELFRPMPKVLATRILEAAARGDFEFKVSSTAELADFRATLRRVLGLRSQLRDLNRQRERAKARQGHRSSEAQRLLGERRAVQRQLAPQEEALARALSPVEASSGERVTLAGGSAGRAGLTLVLPASQQQQVGGMIRNLRQGIHSAPRLALAGDGLALAIFLVQAVNLWGAIEALNDLPSNDRNSSQYLARKKQVWVALIATGAAGFLAAQGIGHTALTTQARVLGQALQQVASNTVYTQLGKLHLGLGFVGYGAGFVAAGFSLYANHGKWQNAVRGGNTKAQGAALLAMGGSAGMMTAYGYGFGSTLLTGLAVRSGAATWAMAGARLASVFWRVNLIGLAASVLELAGTWLYNRYNLSAHATWLHHSPWGLEAGDKPLDHYLQKLRTITQPTHITLLKEHYSETGMWDWLDEASQLVRNPDRYTLAIALPGLTRQMLQAPLGGLSPRRLSLKAWLVQPLQRNMKSGITLAPSCWLSADALVDSLKPRQAEDQSGMTLVGITPLHKQTSHGYSTEHIAVGIRHEWLDGAGGYTASDQVIYIDPAGGTGQDKRYTPSDVEPKGEPVDWHRLTTEVW